MKEVRMTVIGPYLLLEGMDKWWYKFSIDGDRIEIEKTPYSRNLDSLSWQPHEYNSYRESFFYVFDPQEKKSICLVIDRNTLYKVPLHILPPLSSTEEEKSEEPRYVISQIEKLNIVENRPIWMLVNNATARNKYPQIEIANYPIFAKRQQSKFKRLSTRMLEQMLEQSLAENIIEDNEHILLQCNDFLYPENCYFVEEYEDLPETPGTREMYIFRRSYTDWYYRTEFLGKVLEGEIFTTVLDEFKNYFYQNCEGELGALTKLNFETNKYLVKILGTSYLHILPGDQNLIVSTLLPMWPIEDSLTTPEKINRINFLLEDTEYESKSEIYSFDRSIKDELADFKQYIWQTINHFRFHLTHIRLDPLDVREDIVKFINYLLIANLRLLQQNVTLSEENLFSIEFNDTGSEGEQHNTADESLNESQTRLMNLILTVANPDFTDLSMGELLEYKLDLEALIDNRNFYREGVAPVADNVLAVLTHDEGVELARSQFDEMCLLLMLKINVHLCKYVIFEVSTAEIYDELAKVLRNSSEVMMVLNYLSNSEKRVLLKSLKPGYEFYFQDARDLGGILKFLDTNEKDLLIFNLEDHLFEILEDVRDIKILLLSLQDDVTITSNFISYLASNNKLYELITCFEDFIELIRHSSDYLQNELMQFFRPFLRQLIVTEDHFNILLANLNPEVVIGIQPIMLEELDNYINSRQQNLNSLFSILNNENKIRLLYILKEDIGNLLRDKDEFCELINHLNNEGIYLLFNFLSFTTLKFLPFFKDVMQLLDNSSFDDDKIFAIIKSMQSNKILIAYEEEIISIIGKNLNGSDFIENYLYSDFLFQKWPIYKFLLLNPEAHTNYVDFIENRAHCFWTAFSRLCQLNVNIMQTFRMRNTHSFWESQEHNQETTIHLRAQRETISWLLDLLRGKILYSVNDFEAHWETILNTTELRELYESDAMQEILNYIKDLVPVNMEEENKAPEIELNNEDWLNALALFGSPTDITASNEEDMEIQDIINDSQLP